jgi:hypothetical protein
VDQRRRWNGLPAGDAWYRSSEVKSISRFWSSNIRSAVTVCPVRVKVARVRWSSMGVQVIRALGRAAGARTHRSLRRVTVSARVSSGPAVFTIGTSEQSLTRMVAESPVKMCRTSTGRCAMVASILKNRSGWDPYVLTCSPVKFIQGLSAPALIRPWKMARKEPTRGFPTAPDWRTYRATGPGRGSRSRSVSVGPPDCLTDVSKSSIVERSAFATPRRYSVWKLRGP